MFSYQIDIRKQGTKLAWRLINSDTGEIYWIPKKGVKSIALEIPLNGGQFASVKIKYSSWYENQAIEWQYFYEETLGVMAGACPVSERQRQMARAAADEHINRLGFYQGKRGNLF